jgi:hypothetical protein
MENEIVGQSVQIFQFKTAAFLNTAKQIEILDDDGYKEVGAYLLAIKVNRKELDRLFDPAIESAYLEHKARKGMKNVYSKPLDEAEVIIKDKLADFARAQQAKIDAERKVLEDAARAKAQKEQDEKVAALKAAGKEAAAKKAADSPLKIEAIEKVESLKAAGITITQDWDGEVVDMMFLLVSIVEKKVPAQFVKLDTAEVRRFAQATKGQIPLPAVRFFTKDRITARA